jgi:hypothetical protein
MSADPEHGQTSPGQMPVLQPGQSENSSISRFVTIFTPIFVIAAGWIAGLVAKHVPGVHLNQTQIVTFMTAVATSGLVVVWKWLQGWQQHEALVAQGKATPRKPGKAPASMTAVASAPIARASLDELDEDVSGLKKEVNDLRTSLGLLAKDLEYRPPAPTS